jgi:hypothetical protein
MLDKAIRELDRERMQLQQQEKKLVVEIKKMAKEGQMVRGHGTWRAARRSQWSRPHRGAHTRSAPPPPRPAPLRRQDAVKVMAKSLVRNRHAVTKMFQLKSQLQAVSLRMAVRQPGPGGGGGEWWGDGGARGAGSRARSRCCERRPPPSLSHTPPRRHSPTPRCRRSSPPRP